MRYLKGIDDEGREFELSPDPLLDELRALAPEEVLRKEEIFANDLFADDLGERILGIYNELNAGNGAVRKVLHQYVHEAMA